MLWQNAGKFAPPVCASAEQTRTSSEQAPPLRVVLYSGLPRQDRGGVQAVMQNLAANLRSRGNIVTQAWRLPGPEPVADEWVCGLERLKARTGLKLLLAIPKLGWSMLKLAMGLIRRRAMVVNVHFVVAEILYFIVLKRLLGFRLVISVHGSDILRPMTRGIRRHMPLLLRGADAITVVSDDIGHQVRHLLGDARLPVRLIPNGVDLQFWSPAQAGGCTTPYSIVTVGRLVEVKGLDILLRAFREVSAKTPSARLTIIGQGPLEAELKRLSIDLGLDEKVEFAGHLEPLQLRRRLQAAEAFVLPSRSEGLPLSLIEAMACGLPCVGTAVGGVPEVLTSGAGKLVPADDANALAQALIHVLENRAAHPRMRKAARARAEHYSSQHACAEYEKLYRELVCDGPADAN